MPAAIPQKILVRQYEITTEFMNQIDQHLSDLIDGRVTEMYEIRDVADRMHIHPTHLSNTIKLTTGKSPCYFFEDKIMTIAKAMLADTAQPIARIAATLTFDASNFTKFFKRFAGVTPKQYREQMQVKAYEPKTELLTI